MALYDIYVDYNGRKITLHSDPDRVIFINKDKITWDTGIPFTTEEIVEYLKYYGKKNLTGFPKRWSPDDVSFMDGQSQYYDGYGLTIEFDENGEPLIRIEDGKIYSTHVVCTCEQTAYEGAHVSTREKYDSYRERLVERELFTLLDEKAVLAGKSYYQYKCTTCGDIYILPDDITGEAPGTKIAMIRKKNYEAYLERNGINGKDKSRDIARIIRLIVLGLLVTAGIVLLAVLAVNS